MIHISLRCHPVRAGAVCLALSLVPLAVSQTTEHPASPSRAALEKTATLGLPRLQPQTKPDGAAAVSRTEYNVFALAAPQENARIRDRAAHQILEIDREQEWTVPLKASGQRTYYISLLVYASEATVIAVDGAWIGVAKGDASSAYQVMVGEPTATGLTWRPTGQHVHISTFGGARMAALPVLTARIDSSTGAWDLYAGDRIIAESVALAQTSSTDTNPKRLSVRAGKGTTWVCGIVQSNQNPLFEDVNDNGIDDSFEKHKKGGLLSDVTREQRSFAIKEWRESSRSERKAAWILNKPRPD
jgi:hypothetical protein